MTMRAAVFVEPGRVEIREVGRPSPGPGEVLVRVAYCGVCGTDVHGFRSGLIAPDCVIGHEYCGFVEALGEGVVDLEPGRLVAGNSALWCGSCLWCRKGSGNLCAEGRILGVNTHGAMAEYVSVPRHTLHPADRADPRRLALAEPLATALRATRMAALSPGEEVLVTGAGPLGLLCLAVLRKAGLVVTVSEPRAGRRGLAAAMGARTVVDPSRENLAVLASNRRGGGFAAVIECSGAARAIEQAPALLRPGGTVVLVGLPEEPVPTDFLTIVSREVRVLGVFLNAGDDLDGAVGLLEGNAVDVSPLLGVEVDLEEVPAVLSELAEGQGAETGKVLVRLGPPATL